MSGLPQSTRCEALRTSTQGRLLLEVEKQVGGVCVTVSFRFKYNQTQEEASARRGRSGAWSLPVTAAGYVCVCEHVCMCAVCVCVRHCVHVCALVCMCYYTCAHVCMCVLCCVLPVCLSVCVLHCVCVGCASDVPFCSAHMGMEAATSPVPANSIRDYGGNLTAAEPPSPVLTAATWGLQPLTRPPPLSAPSPRGSLFHAPFHSEG